MEAKDLFNDNNFISTAIKLHYDVCTGKKAYINTEELVDKTKWFSGEHKKVKDIVKKEIPIVEEYNAHVRNGLAIAPMYFNNMWNFCQFIRWAEKVVFYKNVSDNTLYVDSAIDDLDCRLLIYNLDEVQIKFKLEKVENPAYIPNTLSDILSMDTSVPRYFKSMKINVERMYGKEMVNKFTIIDNNNKFNDYSDELLYDTIEIKLMNEIEKTIKIIFNMIYDIYKIDD